MCALFQCFSIYQVTLHQQVDFIFLENVAFGAGEEKQHAVWGNGNPDDRIDIVVFPVDGFWGDGFPHDISFGIDYRYENRVVHHYIEIENAELIEQNAWYKDEGRRHIKQNVAGSVSQRVTDQNRQEDNQKMQQAYDKDYAWGYDGGFCPLCKKLLAAFLCLRHVVVQKFSPIEVDDEWGNDGTDFQRERKHETGTVVYEE